MSSPSYIKNRNAELYLRYYEQLRDNPNMTHQQAVEAAAKSPTSRYWVSYYQVYREILNILKGRPLRKTIKGLCRKQIYDIFEVYQQLAAKPTFKGCSVFLIVQFAVAEPGKEFYLSYPRAMCIINQMKRDYVIEEIN